MAGDEQSTFHHSDIPSLPAVEVAAGLVFREGRLLITRRHDDAHLGGLWEFPGGKREAGESFEDCLRRELKEELDVEVRVHEVIQTIMHAYPEKRVLLHFYRCSLVKGEPSPVDCSDLAWVRPDQLANYSFPAADASLLSRLIKSPELWD